MRVCKRLSLSMPTPTWLCANCNFAFERKITWYYDCNCVTDLQHKFHVHMVTGFCFFVLFQILYDDYQSDAPVDTATSMEVCPPVPPDVSDDACAEANCNSDIDCDIDFRCCFTGCAFTCVPEIKPAAG